MDKIKINVEARTFDYSELEGSIDEVILKIREVESELISEGYSDLSISIGSDYDYSSINVYGERLETDDEHHVRIEKEMRQREGLKLREEQERAMYEELKIKFG